MIFFPEKDSFSSPKNGLSGASFMFRSPPENLICGRLLKAWVGPEKNGKEEEKVYFKQMTEGSVGSMASTRFPSRLWSIHNGIHSRLISGRGEIESEIKRPSSVIVSVKQNENRFFFGERFFFAHLEGWEWEFSRFCNACSCSLNRPFGERNSRNSFQSEGEIKIANIFN